MNGIRPLVKDPMEKYTFAILSHEMAVGWQVARPSAR